MKNFVFILFLGISLTGFCQDTKKMTYGGKTYEVKFSKSFDGDTEFKTINLNDSISIWRTITKLVAEKKISTYEPIPAFYSKIKTIRNVELTYTTWQGYTHCTNVAREYVRVVVNDMEDHFILITKADFEIVLKTFEKGKYSGLGPSFLYEKSIKYMNVIIFE